MTASGGQGDLAPTRKIGPLGGAVARFSPNVSPAMCRPPKQLSLAPYLLDWQCCSSLTVNASGCQRLLSYKITVTISLTSRNIFRHSLYKKLIFAVTAKFYSTTTTTTTHVGPWNRVFNGGPVAVLLPREAALLRGTYIVLYLYM